MVRLKIHFFSLLVPSGFRCHLLSGKGKFRRVFGLLLLLHHQDSRQRSLPAVDTGSNQPTEKLTVLMAVAAAAEHIFTGVSSLIQIVVLAIFSGPLFLFWLISENFSFLCFLSKDTQNLGEQACHSS